MYQIIVTINGKEVVADTADNIVSASNYTSFYRLQGYQAWYRATKVA